MKNADKRYTIVAKLRNLLRLEKRFQSLQLRHLILLFFIFRKRFKDIREISMKINKKHLYGGKCILECNLTQYKTETAPKRRLIPINQRLLYQISIPKLSTLQMKENSGKGVLNQKHQQNHTNKSDTKAIEQNLQNSHTQEVKGSQKFTQFLFKKQEKRGRGRTKQTPIDLKPHNQAPLVKVTENIRQQAPKNDSFPEKLLSIDKYTGKQQYDSFKLLQKTKKQKNGSVDHQGPQHAFIDKQALQKSKKQKKQLKKLQKAQKQKIESQMMKEEGSQEVSSLKKEHNQHFSQHLTNLFRQKYPFYMIGSSIIFPIEDSLFTLYPQLSTNLNCSSKIIPKDIIQKLSNNFNKELQIWNMLIQNAKFFQINEEIKITDIQSMLKDQNSEFFKKLFKNFHRFYFNDVLYHRYDQSSNQQYYSFISLWRYADQNNFLDKVFHTGWNKFIIFYISLIKNHYSNEVIKQEFDQFVGLIEEDLSQGRFTPPETYEKLLDYVIFLINMSFQTYTFKALINGKMLFFRDNNKMKNQLLDQKKNYENELWTLKQSEKSISKQEKQVQKMYKKESKNSQISRVQSLRKQIQNLNETKSQILSKKEQINQKVFDIDNKIYQLCCLPEFSNVWLLGQDRDRNLYWFIREQEYQIYRQEYNSGQWGIIKFEGIQKLHSSLNSKGIRQRRLYQKILYYKQLGYIKTQRGLETNSNGIQVKEQDLMVDEVKQQNQLRGEDSSVDRKNNRDDLVRSGFDVNEYDRFVYGEYELITPAVVKLMILKGEWMMTKYLYQRNSKWISEEQRLEYIHRMTHADLTDLTIYEALTNDLRSFNEKICVVEINIKVVNEGDNIDVKTRKIQTKIWGINEKYKHFWYDYSRKCHNLSDLHFLVSVLYLTIEKYVTKTRKPNNTKYFFKTVEFGQVQQHCEVCQTNGQLHNCLDCQAPCHLNCLPRHSEQCTRRNKSADQVQDLLNFDQ